MAKKNNAVPTSHNATGRGTPIRDILNGDLPSEALRLRAGPLLTGKDLVRNIMAMTPQDQAEFLDKVDQV
jgi:hypothetical protein